MIKSRQDLRFYLEADRLALGIKSKKPRLIGDDIWKYQIVLRKFEYYSNTRSLLGRFWRLYYRYRYYKLGLLLNFQIPINTCGPGLNLAHRGPVVVNHGTKIGRNCRIHSCVNIGTEAGHHDRAPHIGDNVYIGPGAKLFGLIAIPDGVVIGAGAIVNRSVAEPNVTVAGVPARIVSHKSSDGLIIKGADLAAGVMPEVGERNE